MTENECKRERAKKGERRTRIWRSVNVINKYETNKPTKKKTAIEHKIKEIRQKLFLTVCGFWTLIPNLSFSSSLHSHWIANVPSCLVSRFRYVCCFFWQGFEAIFNFHTCVCVREWNWANWYGKPIPAHTQSTECNWNVFDLVCVFFFKYLHSWWI